MGSEASAEPGTRPAEPPRAQAGRMESAPDLGAPDRPLAPGLSRANRARTRAPGREGFVSRPLELNNRQGCDSLGWMKIRTLDLFCGGGGSSWGAEAAGARIAAGIDAWDVAVETYAANFPGARAFKR